MHLDVDDLPAALMQYLVFEGSCIYFSMHLWHAQSPKVQTHLPHAAICWCTVVNVVITIIHLSPCVAAHVIQAKGIGLFAAD